MPSNNHCVEINTVIAGIIKINNWVLHVDCGQLIKVQLQTHDYLPDPGKVLPSATDY